MLRALSMSKGVRTKSVPLWRDAGSDVDEIGYHADNQATFGLEVSERKWGDEGAQSEGHIKCAGCNLSQQLAHSGLQGQCNDERGNHQVEADGENDQTTQWSHSAAVTT